MVVPAHDVNEGDLLKTIQLFKEVQEKIQDANTHIQTLCQRAETGEFATSKGISFLEVKYQLLLSYLMNLSYIMVKKTGGKSIQGDASIERLVEIRTVLEKMRPIDQKLKYQIDKVMKAAAGAPDSSDPLRFRANPGNLVSKLDTEMSEDEEEDEEVKGSKPKLYIPPKLAAVHYDGDETVAEREQRKLQHARQRALNSTMMREIRAEYTDAPEEIKESTNIHRFKEDKRTKEKERYEEENFIRMSVSKKEKNAAKRLGTMSSLNSLVHFDDISALNNDDGFSQGPSAKKRKVAKGIKKGRGKKKGFHKKR
ncbi:hypothetical protein ACJMK2_010765 [Sinanodonta woodiana]|uniref:Neuroguidin n=1 Tax=Sinanodonta woodiana TaxID=1069815 RepID=A0ABD3VGF1_SINWO